MSRSECVPKLPLHQYSSLSGYDWIRILELLPGDDTEILKCRLLTVQLSKNSSYETLSYVWGDPSHPVAIECNNGHLDIGQNLHAALRRLQDTTEHRHFWADAICIDQSNTAERSHQVSLMGQIYWKAQHLNIWLGPDENGNAERVFSLIRDAAAKIESSVSAANMEWCIPSMTLDDIFDGHASATRIALRDMLFLPWFYRVWIVQENGLSNEATFRWGSAQLDRTRWFTLLRFLYENRETLLLTFRVNLTPFYLSINYWKPTRSKDKEDAISGYQAFLDCLMLARSLQATDPRDHVYAFLAYPIFAQNQGDSRSFLDESGSFTSGTEMEITPDYTRAAADIYTDLGIRYLTCTQDLRFLSCVSHPGPIKNDMPSWIPRWDEGIAIGRYLALESDSWYDASRGALKSLNIGPDHHLHLRGIILDGVIQGVANVMNGAEFLFEHVTGTPEIVNPGNPLEELLEAVGPHLSRLALPYPNAMTALALTLTDGMMGSNPGDSDLEQFEANFSAYRIAKSKQLKTVWTGEDQSILQNMEAVAAKGDASRYATDIYKACNGRKFFFTGNGCLGLGRSATAAGDVCCILYGSKVPFILRPTDEKGHYRLVGEAYCHSFMREEAVDGLLQGKLVEEDITLI
jgi:hypothetical protein